MKSRSRLAPWGRTFRKLFVAALSAGAIIASAQCAVWQWSVPMGTGRAFLWVPPECKQVRAVVVGQNNMIEQGILEHSEFRKTLAQEGIAEVFIAPIFDLVFHYDEGAGQKFEDMMNRLASASGYSELSTAPIIPLGHSACASYPWNFAAWNPGRTLAILSVHGDSPQTNLPGSGQPNPDWGTRNIDGIPALMVMGEYEWTDGRLTPALAYMAKHPKAAIAMLAEPASGHFNYSDDLVKFLAMFVKKAAEERLPAQTSSSQTPVLKPVDPSKGWLVERWYLNKPRDVQPAPHDQYAGDRKEAFWAFDKETALAIQNYGADQPGKLPQLLSITDDQTPADQGCGEPVTPRFLPEKDGVTFHLNASFMPAVSANGNAARWAYLPVGAPLGHASGGGPIVLHKIVGPVEQVGPDTFRYSLDMVSSVKDRRDHDIWVWASHPGDAKYKGIVQQANVRVPTFTDGAEQQITFPAIPDQKVGTISVPLKATSDSGRKVYYYVLQGPAKVEGDTLRLTEIPPRAKFPVKVVVVAWQPGNAGDPKLKDATPIERTFSIVE
jgi:hypothetical protein